MTCPVRTDCVWSLLTGLLQPVAYPGILFGELGGSSYSLEGRENGDLGVVAPYSGVLEAAVIWYKKFHIGKVS